MTLKAVPPPPPLTLKPGRPKGKTTFDPDSARAFGVVTRRRRVALGISQDALARMAEIEPSYVSKLERGVHVPNLTMILRLARVLECEPGILMDETLAELNQAD